MGRLLRWFRGQPKILARLRELPSDLVEHQVEWTHPLVIDAFLFEQKVPWEGARMTPVEIFLATHPMTSREEEAFARLKGSVFSLFEVRGVCRGVGLSLRDRVTERGYEVLETIGSDTLAPGDHLMARVVPYYRNWLLTGAAVPMEPLDEGAHVVLRAFSLPGGGVRCLDLLTGRIERWVSVGVEDLDDAERRLREKVDALGIPMTLNDIPRRVGDARTLRDAFPEVFEFDFPSMEEEDEATALATAVWGVRRDGGIGP